MKKAAFLAAAALLLLLCGCAASEMPSDNAYHRETDYPYSMFMELNTKGFAESDTGFYFYIPSFLFYMDRETMQPAAVCSKPECLHYDEPDTASFRNCSAYFSAGVRPPLFWYKGAVYIISMTETAGASGASQQAALIRVSGDGTKRTVLYRFSPDAVIERAILHRGVLYAAIQQYTEDAQLLSGIWAYSLDNTKKEPACIMPLDKYPGLNLEQNLTAYGCNLYFTRYLSETEERELCIYNTVTGETTVVPSTEDGYSPSYVTFLGDKMYLKYKAHLPVGDPEDVNSYPERVYRCGLDGSEPERIWEGLGFFAADDQYLYRVSNLWADRENDHYIEICDEDGKPVDRIDLFEATGDEKLISASCHVSMGDRVLIETTRRDSTGLRYRFYWFDKAEIGSGRIRVHPFIDFGTEYSDQSRG